MCGFAATESKPTSSGLCDGSMVCRWLTVLYVWGALLLRCLVTAAQGADVLPTCGVPQLQAQSSAVSLTTNCQYIHKELWTNDTT